MARTLPPPDDLKYDWFFVKYLDDRLFIRFNLSAESHNLLEYNSTKIQYQAYSKFNLVPKYLAISYIPSAESLDFLSAPEL